MDRIYGSRFELSQGADFSVSCFPGDAATCPGQYQGRLQPYAIYIPKKPMPRRGYGLTLLLHSLSANYNQYLGTRNQSQFGERGRGSIVITPEARGPDEFYENYGAADVFDVWSDVASRYKLDPDWTVTTGYSMGGIGSFKLAAHYPDLFARIQPTVGDEGDVDVLASLRNVPVLMWNNHGDELVNNLGFQETADALDALGYRYELDAFQPCANPSCSPLFPNHLQLAINDWYAPAGRVPRHRAGRAEPGARDLRREPGARLPGPQAGRRPRLLAVAAQAARRRGAGPDRRGLARLRRRRPAARARPSAARARSRAATSARSSTRCQKKAWGERADAAGSRTRSRSRRPGSSPPSLHVKRARVDCDAEIEIESDGPLSITLAGCDRTVTG